MLKGAGCSVICMLMGAPRNGVANREGTPKDSSLYSLDFSGYIYLFLLRKWGRGPSSDLFNLCLRLRGGGDLYPLGYKSGIVVSACGIPFSRWSCQTRGWRIIWACRWFLFHLKLVSRLGGGLFFFGGGGGTTFFVQGVYTKIRDRWSEEDLTTVRLCRLLWKWKAPFFFNIKRRSVINQYKYLLLPS